MTDEETEKIVRRAMAFALAQAENAVMRLDAEVARLRTMRDDAQAEVARLQAELATLRAEALAKPTEGGGKA